MTWHIGIGRRRGQRFVSCASCKSRWNINTACRWPVQVLVEPLLYLLLCTFREPVKIVVVLVLVLLGVRIPCRVLSLRSSRLAVVVAEAGHCFDPDSEARNPCRSKSYGRFASRWRNYYRRFMVIVVMRRWTKIPEMNSQEMPRQLC